MRRRAVVPIVALVAVIGAAITALSIHPFAHSTPTVQLLPKEVRVTRCQSDDNGFLTGAADVFNPTSTRANLVFALEFYSGNQNVGLVRYSAPRVAAGRHVLLTDFAPPDALFIEKLMRPTRLTCTVVAFGDGGIVRHR